MREEKEWRKDLAREYLIYKIPSWLSGVWPLLPDNFYTAFRFYVAVILLVIIQISFFLIITELITNQYEKRLNIVLDKYWQIQ